MKMTPEQRMKPMDIQRKMIKVLYKEIAKEMHTYTTEMLLHESKFILDCRQQNKNYCTLLIARCSFALSYLWTSASFNWYNLPPFVLLLDSS